MKSGSITSRRKKNNARDRTARPIALSRRERRARADACNAIRHRITDELQRSYAYSQGIEEPAPRYVGDYVTYYTLPDTDRKLAFFDGVLGCRYNNLRDETKPYLELLHSKAYRSRRLNQERFMRNQKRKRYIRLAVNISQLALVSSIGFWIATKVTS